MLPQWPIRYKFLLQLGLLIIIVVTLATVSLMGLYSYRAMVKSVSGRAAELPFTTALGQHTSDLRVTLTEIRQQHTFDTTAGSRRSLNGQVLRQQFGMNLQAFKQTLAQYRKQLKGNEKRNSSIGNSHRERETVHKIEEALVQIDTMQRDNDWIRHDDHVARVDVLLESLQDNVGILPSFLHRRMGNFANDVRLAYRTWMAITWIASIAVAAMVALFVRLFFTWVIGPLQTLINGSRRVASGDFDHRIHLESEDEMSELATAMNSMTERFQAIRDDLDRQVQERTIEVVRSEQLASVGFLAAGVAHEINNPMASIAMCAESLEQRLNEGAVSDEAQANTARRYLQMIQDEAFRCKAITEQLLDFSRTGDGQRQNTDLRELIQGVIEMVRHLGKTEQKKIELARCKSVIGFVNPQEMKQVILNLITNALDSISAGGSVTIRLGICDDQAEIVVEDDGCGMTDEVRQNLFEPFFTRRRSGQGTGLGLSIVYRIVANHDGRIEAESDGEDAGSRFRVMLPLAGSQNRHDNQKAA